jgi:AraC-like DNA-binding protein
LQKTSFELQKTSFVILPLRMLHSPVTIPIAFVHGMLDGVRARGIPQDGFLHDAGIPAELMQQAGARVTVDQYVALFRLLGERQNDECLGFLSRPLKPGGFALTARSAIGAGTLGVAMRRIAKTFWLLQDDVEMQILREGQLVGVSLRFCDPEVERPVFLHTLLLRVYWRLLAWLAGGQLRASRFDFAFPCPPYVDGFAKIFPGPTHFDCNQSAFWFDATRMQEPVRRDDAALRAFLADAQANVVVPRRSEEATSAKVRSHLQRTQPEWPDLTTTAAALHLSAPTLQRRLGKEGTSFQSLKDELRRDCAIMRLNTSNVPLAALADELGFADSAAFQRAFKSWTGSAPGSYMQSAGRLAAVDAGSRIVDDFGHLNAMNDHR